MTTYDREERRATFNQDADLYDRSRPGYPDELISDLVRLAGVTPGSRVLEIGCGTGQLTLPLAMRGCEIVALDLGPDLAAIARRKLEGFPRVQVIVSAFEEWSLPDLSFDAIVSATAFHWLDPAVRVKKAATALRPEGVLATIATHHVAGGSAEFFSDAQFCYQRWDTSTPSGFTLPTAADIPFESDELDASGKFQPTIFRRYEWEQTYTAANYRDLLLTYSGNRALPPGGLQGLLDCIANLIDSRYGGHITKRYMNELRIARRRPDVPPSPLGGRDCV
jgi:SAM-dependent methyltransferase